MPVHTACQWKAYLLFKWHFFKRCTSQVVAAATRALGIGKNGSLPWNLSSELKHFSRLTTSTRSSRKRNAVLMGRRTWESLPHRAKPLSNRLNLVLSSSISPSSLPESVMLRSSLEDALRLLAQPPYSDDIEHVLVIGGGEVYSHALQSPLCDVVHLTEVHTDAECDTFMPSLSHDNTFRLYATSGPQTDRSSKLRYTILAYIRHDDGCDTSNGSPTFRNIPTLPAGCQAKHAEHDYLQTVRDVLEDGEEKPDRTGTGTLSLFGVRMRFDLRRSFPLLTTKRTFWRGIAEELLWFISGSTDAHKLRDRGIKIWDGNGSREYLDSVGLTEREEGDLGPIYGFQWRHFGADYKGRDANYEGAGVDQLRTLIDGIRHDPHGRRHILSAWNPADMSKMALPPCHAFCQFYVNNSNELSCQMYQRSCDLGLGVPFNIASYALLTYLIAQVTSLRPGELVHVMGDAHVYSNHVDALKKQLEREPRPFPTLAINAEKTDIDNITMDDLELKGYDPHPKLDMKMAV